MAGSIATSIYLLKATKFEKDGKDGAAAKLQQGLRFNLKCCEARSRWRY